MRSLCVGCHGNAFYPLGHHNFFVLHRELFFSFQLSKLNCICNKEGKYVSNWYQLMKWNWLIKNTKLDYIEVL